TNPTKKDVPMKKMNASSRILVATGIAAAVLAGCASMGGPPTTFFITSANPTQMTGNLGGLAGADATCEKLAAAVGAGGRNWRAYLSTQAVGGAQAVNARDRIGNGPWFNSKGVMVAYNLADLHGTNNINKETALTEMGEVIPARPDPVNAHDIMTGSRPDGTAMPPERDATCSNWTAASGGGAMVGHHNRGGINPDPVANVSWNSSHITPGCDKPSLERVGGQGLFYCFAAK
ncbi:MAG TPA: hypothetical protein VK961_03140, partial [Chthoniobacter sp.]|nr:hypothetical protein [Chthoniobacter sp.]